MGYEWQTEANRGVREEQAPRFREAKATCSPRGEDNSPTGWCDDLQLIADTTPPPTPLVPRPSQGADKRVRTMRLPANRRDRRPRRSEIGQKIPQTTRLRVNCRVGRGLAPAAWHNAVCANIAATLAFPNAGCPRLRRARRYAALRQSREGGPSKTVDEDVGSRFMGKHFDVRLFEGVCFPIICREFRANAVRPYGVRADLEWVAGRGQS